jgi:hypothetical protein
LGEGGEEYADRYQVYFISLLLFFSKEEDSAKKETRKRIIIYMLDMCGVGTSAISTQSP